MPERPSITYQKLVQSIQEDDQEYAESQLKEVYKNKNDSMNEVIKWIAGIFTTSIVVEGILKPSKTEKRKLQMEFANILTSKSVDMSNKEEKVTSSILKDITEETFYKQQFLIQSGFSKDMTFGKLTKEQIEEIVYSNYKNKMFSQRIWDNQDELTALLQVELNQAILKGKSIDKVTKAVKDRFAQSAYNAKRLCVTEMARCQSEAAARVYRDSGVVNRVMYDATLDTRTSDICQELDGQMFDSNSNYPKPPQHPNCRSAIIPVIDGWEPNKKKENIKNVDGEKPVIDYKKYNEWKKDAIPRWLNNQDKSTIEKYLGGYNKRILYEAGVLKQEDYHKSLKELQKNGTIVIDRNNIVNIHSSKGDFKNFVNPKKPYKGGGRLEKGGHSQKNIEEFDRLKSEYQNHPKYNEFKKNFEYNIVKTYKNGVRVGNIPNHIRKNERSGLEHAWFPKDWDDEKIHIAGTYVANLKDRKLFTKKMQQTGAIFKRAEYDNVKVITVIHPDGKIGTIFPDNDQS